MTEPRPRVAAVTTVWRQNSHADVMLPKLLAGYDLDGTAVRPGVEVVSLYVDQFPENDLSRRWAQRFGVPIFPSVAEALTVGGDRLAVDAVLIVGEHGEYPWNEKGQHLYPRRELFEQSVAVIEGSGRQIPIFNDKHLSFTWENAVWMRETARRLGLPFMAGSSLPVTFRQPALSLPLGAKIEEALVLSHGPTESYGFHALETLQCMVERRAGGETGVAAVELLHGDAFWAAWDGGQLPPDLYEAALGTTAHQESDIHDYFASRPVGRGDVPGPHPPVAFLVQYRDGLKATLLNLGGYVSDFCFAARVGGQVVASAFKLQGSPPRWHFNFLTHHIEQFFRSGRAPYPVERTLLTTGTLAALMDSGGAGRRLETPHLGVGYEAPAEEARTAAGTSIPEEEVWGFRPEAV
jgi:hypothetical protein